MPATLIPAKLSFTAEGTPYSAAFDDEYRSSEGGTAQARHVYLAGNDLPGQSIAPRADDRRLLRRDLTLG